MPTFHRRSPIAFAHRGGRAHFRDNTLVAFRNALSSGLRALETDAWLSADGAVVLDHGGAVPAFLGFGRRRISGFERSALPQYIPTLAELCQLAGPDVDVQIDIKGRVDITEQVVDVWRTHLPNSMDRLWVARDGYKSPDFQSVIRWRSYDPDIHLVDTTRVRRFDIPANEYAARARLAGFDVINLPARQWHRELVKIVHDAGLLAFGFGAQKSEMIEHLVAIGIDGVYSDHVDRLLKISEGS